MQVGFSPIQKKLALQKMLKDKYKNNFSINYQINFQNIKLIIKDWTLREKIAEQISLN